jgi:hypothetical protein
VYLVFVKRIAGGTPVTEYEKTRKAAQLVEAMTGFYVHLFVFILVIALLLAVNWFATPDVWWVQWPFLGWGIGVAAHALLVYGNMPNRSNVIARWRLQKIRELRARM